MKPLLDAVASAAANAVREALPAATVSAITLLPSGTDPFSGTPRPLLYSSTRLVAAAPAGVLVGAGPEAMGEVLGFAIPPRDPAKADAAGKDEEDWDPAPEGDATPPPADTEDEDPPAWSDLLADAARDALTELGSKVAVSIAELVNLPAEVATTHVALTDHPRREVGLLPYAIALEITGPRGDQIRLVTVVSSIVLARLGVPSRADDDAVAAGLPAELPLDVSPSIGAHGLSGAAGRFANMPLTLTLHMGTTHLPVAEVMALRDGDVLELDAAVDDPVALVAGETPVVHGRLEVDDRGALVLSVTGIPGQSEAAPSASAETADAPPQPGD